MGPKKRQIKQSCLSFCVPPPPILAQNYMQRILLYESFVSF